MNRTRGGLGTFDAGSGLLQQASVLFQNIVNAIDANPANEQQQRISVSLAASVLRLEIRRHKARGGGALSDPLLLAPAVLEVRRRIGWVHSHFRFCDRSLAYRGSACFRRASASSYGFQSPTRPPEID